MQVFKYLSSTLAVVALPTLSKAQSEVSFYEQYQLEIVLGMAAVVSALALLSLITILIALKALLKDKQPVTAVEHPTPVVNDNEGFWTSLWNRLNPTVPIAEEASIMTAHEYDGIRELDNKLPPWWLYSFYATIVFAVAYLLHFHVFNTGSLQQDEYDREVAQAKAEVEAYLASAGNTIDESNVTFSDDEQDLAIGREIFTSKCAACHGQQGEGTVGPNLTDQYWINGGDMQAIFKTVKYGVPSRGMIPWESQLTAKEIQQVSSFIYTLEGSNPPNAKEPQGELVERAEQIAGQQKENLEADI